MDKKLKFKIIVTVGEVGISKDMPESIMIPKVKCTTAMLVDVNRCLHCKFNGGLINQYTMGCSRTEKDEIPEDDGYDYDIKVKVENYGEKTNKK
jgi:hypothetical protein